jgi:acetyl esterase/lipase
LIQVGEPEVLVDDSRWLAKRLRDAGSDATLEIWDHMPHIWQFFGQILDEGREATERASLFIRKHLYGDSR